MPFRRFLLLLLSVACACLLVRSWGLIQRERGKASQEAGGTPGADGKIPRLWVRELVAGEHFSLDVLYPSERASEIYLGYSFRSACQDVSDLFGHGAVVGLDLRGDLGPGPGFAPVRSIGTTATRHRVSGIVPSQLGGRTLYLQAFVEDEEAVGGYALSDVVSRIVRRPEDRFSYHVDPEAGFDTGPGTAGAPWKSLEESISRLNPGDELVVHGGTYRERVVIRNSGTPGFPIRIRAADGESPVVSGTELIEGWDFDDTRGAYVAIWDEDPVQIYVDGASLERARDEDEPLTEGHYRYREGALEVLLEGGANPDSHTLEAVKRDRGLWFKEVEWVTVEGLQVFGTAEQGVSLDGCRNLRLSEVHVQDALTNHGFQILESTDCLFEDCSATGCGDLETHHAGFHVGDWSQRVVLAHCRAQRNALLGISLYRVRDCLVYGCTASENIEGIIAEEAPLSWIVACVAFGNRNGIGTDGNRVECPGMRVERCVSRDNGGNGFTSFENPSGSFFYRNLSFGNGSPWGNGFWLHDTTGDTLVHNTSLGNTGSGFSVEGECRSVLLANCIAAENRNAQLAVLPPSADLDDVLVSLHNLFFGDDRPTVQWGWDYFSSLEEFRSRFGVDEGSLSRDPLLQEAEELFSPQSSSPCIDAGASFGASFLGQGPDLGAREVE